MARIISWFATSKGRFVIHCCVGFSAVSVFGAHFAVHGPLLDNFKDLFQAYSNGSKKPLSPKVKQFIENVLDASTISEKEKERLTFFNVVGHDFFNAGGKNSFWGGAIGIPFTFEDKSDLNFEQLKLQGRTAVDLILDGQDLIDAIVLSENAKKFGLLREIYSCDIKRIFHNATISMFCIAIPAAFIRNCNIRLDAFQRFSFKRRALFYTICYLGAVVFYKCLKDPLSHLYEKDWDEKAAKTGLDYLEGGIDFYESTLRKNKALRRYLGISGKWLFCENGNENFLFLMPKLPLTKRLEFLTKLRQDQVEMEL